MRALVFVHRSSCFHIGHVGWAFEWHRGYFNAGAVENWRSLPINPPETMDFWTAKTLDPVAAMRRYEYDAYKIIEVPDAQPEAAWKTVCWVGQQRYIVVGRNCMDDTYDVLRAYGVTTLPLPARSLLPNRWFDLIAGKALPTSACVALEGWGRLLWAIPRLRERACPIETDGIAPPPWHTEGSSPWEAVREAMAHLLHGQGDATSNP